MPRGVTPNYPSTANAYTASDEMQYGDYLYYEKVDYDDDGTYDCIEITDCDESATSVDIPSEIDGLLVTEIGYGAFKDCINLTSVTISDGVAMISSSVFENCTSLASITIPDGVAMIGGNVFKNCTSLANITIPNGVDSIAMYAFSGCSSLENITIPDSVMKINYQAFSGCTSLASIKIPDSVTHMGQDVFEGTALLENQMGVKYADTWVVGCDEDVTDAKIKEGTIGIAVDAFSWSKSLISITIPDSIEFIDGWGIGHCTSLTAINVSERSQNYCSEDGILFNKDKTTLIKYPIGNEKTEYVFPDSITSINDDSFRGCEKLESLIIPDSVVSIGDSAFENCTNLESIRIGKCIAEIGSFAFDDTKWLELKREENPLVIVNNIVIDGQTCQGDVTIPDGIATIAPCAFYGDSGIENVTIPESVTLIDRQAFYHCQNLKNITILNPECEIYYWNITISNNEDYNYKEYFNGTIYSYENSTAHEYAERWGYNFESLGAYPGFLVSNVVSLQKYIVGAGTLTEDEAAKFDLNGDGVLNVFDVVLMKRAILYK